MIKSIQQNECFFSSHYTAGNQTKTEAIDNYLRIMFMPLIKKYFPQHYLIKSKSKCYQSYLDSHCQTHKFFLRFNIDQLYLKVTNYSIGAILLRNFEELYGSSAPEHMYQHFETGPDLWFCEKPWNTALPHERDLLCFVVGIYLLGLYASLSRWPFLGYHHEFVVLFRSKSEIEECLSLVQLELTRLKLSIDNNMTCSGKLKTNGFRFMDFVYKGNDYLLNQFVSPHPEKNEMQLPLQKNKSNIICNERQNIILSRGGKT